MHLYTLRPAREADLPFLRALRVQSMREHLENSGLADAAAAAAGIAVELSVLKANPAQRLYARLGFRPVGEAARAYTLRWTPPRAAKA